MEDFHSAQPSSSVFTGVWPHHTSPAQPGRNRWNSGGGNKTPMSMPEMSPCASRPLDLDSDTGSDAFGPTYGTTSPLGVSPCMQQTGTWVHQQQQRQYQSQNAGHELVPAVPQHQALALMVPSGTASNGKKYREDVNTARTGNNAMDRWGLWVRSEAGHE